MTAARSVLNLEAKWPAEWVMRTVSQGAAWCLQSGGAHGGLHCAAVLHHFPKASPILQADCMHYHMVRGSWNMQKIFPLFRTVCMQLFVHAGPLAIINKCHIFKLIIWIVEWRFIKTSDICTLGTSDYMNIKYKLEIYSLMLCVLYYGSCISQPFLHWTVKPSQGQFSMIHFVPLFGQSASVYLSVFWLTGALQLFRSIQSPPPPLPPPPKKKKTFSQCCFLSLLPF